MFGDDPDNAKRHRDKQRLETEAYLKRRNKIREQKEANNPIVHRPRSNKNKSGSKTYRAYKPKTTYQNGYPVYRRGMGGEFYETREWLELHYKALDKYKAICMCCGATRHDGVRIHVDHIKPRSLYPELELNFDNLQVLCRNCNIGKSNKYTTDWRSKNGPNT